MFYLANLLVNHRINIARRLTSPQLVTVKTANIAMTRAQAQSFCCPTGTWQIVEDSALRETVWWID